jgi:hypothetical protein
MSEVEEQQSELVRMMNGFDVQVHPDDNDAVHIQVIEEWMQKPESAQMLNTNPQLMQRIEMHANLHIQSEAMKNGTKASVQKGGQTQGRQATTQGSR